MREKARFHSTTNFNSNCKKRFEASPGAEREKTQVSVPLLSRSDLAMIILMETFLYASLFDLRRGGDC